MSLSIIAISVLLVSACFLVSNSFGLSPGSDLDKTTGYSSQFGKHLVNPEKVPVKARTFGIEGEHLLAADSFGLGYSPHYGGYGGFHGHYGHFGGHHHHPYHRFFNPSHISPFYTGGFFRHHHHQFGYGGHHHHFQQHYGFGGYPGFGGHGRLSINNF